MTEIPNRDKGALVGVGVATVIALLHAIAPIERVAELASWFPKGPTAPYRFLSAFLYTMPFAILVGSVLGIMADDLWTSFAQRLLVLMMLAVVSAALASSTFPALTTYALIAAAAGGISLAWWSAPVE